MNRAEGYTSHRDTIGDVSYRIFGITNGGGYLL